MRSAKRLVGVLAGDSQCGDGIVAPIEDCDRPGWASCTEGAACGDDCLCPTMTSTTVPPP